MKIENYKLKISVDLSHHAYLLVGGDSLANEIISELESRHKIPAKANPDFFNRKYDTFTIDNAREIKSFHETRPISESGKKIFILTMNGITVEAQNALLKLLEEPSEYAHFFLIIPSAHLLLPTVKSRMQMVGDNQTAEKSDLSEAKKFLKLSPAKKLEAVKSLVDDISKEKKTKQDAIEFLNSIEQAVYEEKGVKSSRKILEAMQLARRYINDRAPSVKMLLEYMALNI